MMSMFDIRKCGFFLASFLLVMIPFSVQAFEPECEEYNYMTSNLATSCSNTQFSYHITPFSNLVQNKVKELTQGLNDKWDKAERLYEFVYNIPYPIECDLRDGDLCIYGWWKPDLVLLGEKNTADCKTKASLLVSLLRASGFSEREVFQVFTCGHSNVIIKYQGKWLNLDPTNTDDFWQGLKVQHTIVCEVNELGNDKYIYSSIVSGCTANINVNTDFCAGVSCGTYCNGNTLYENGHCNPDSGICLYDKRTCTFGCENGNCVQCQELGFQNSHCSNDKECCEGKCIDGFCRLEDGESCSSDSECISLYCVNGECYNPSQCKKEGQSCLGEQCCSGECQHVYRYYLEGEWVCVSDDVCNSDSDCKYCDGTKSYKADCEHIVSGDKYESCNYLFAEIESCEGCVDDYHYYSGCQNGECVVTECDPGMKCSIYTGKCNVEDKCYLKTCPDTCSNGYILSGGQCNAGQCYYPIREKCDGICFDGECLDICGNGICDDGFGETHMNCPQDCEYDGFGRDIIDWLFGTLEGNIILILLVIGSIGAFAFSI